ncbi:hypothetical protein M8C13_04340 [Crossiella sp. SN42]|uniref:hypothetical protein n=1 Tax=Crossiella sp. SN42 TaxID=2944808 RepID=UPI00207C8F8E|nr:hypothetical protein [Crossiella sp. SN42]MCO1574987.1 hypothetical protein [Crossiella sp. SN42]
MTPAELRRAEERADLVIDVATLIAGTVLGAGLVGAALSVVGEHFDRAGPLAVLLLLVAGMSGALAVGGLAQRVVSRLLHPVRVAPTRCTNRRPR